MSTVSLPTFISRRVLRGRYLFLESGPDPGGASSVACAGWEECSADYEISRREFRYHALEYIAGGEWDLLTAEGRWTLGPGSVFVYGPAIPYELKPLSKTGLSKYFVDFADDSALAHLGKAGLTPGVPGTLVQRRWLHDLLDQLIDLSQLRPAARHRLAAMIARLVLERLREDLRPVQLSSPARMAFERCREYLAANYLEVSNLGEAARKCGVSQVHLCRLFKRHATESPQAFVTRLKINHAAESIARGKLTVKEAAAEAGFADPYHFSRVFKKVHGVPPSRFGSIQPTAGRARSRMPQAQ